MMNYSVSSEIKDILFQYQFTPHSGALTGLPIGFGIPASGSYVQSLGIPLSLGQDILANAYIVSESGRYLLEVNHIPSVTCFAELWEEYMELVAAWAGRHAEPRAAASLAGGSA